MSISEFGEEPRDGSSRRHGTFGSVTLGTMALNFGPSIVDHGIDVDDVSVSHRLAERGS